jgi:hypothetical protein
MIEASVFRTWFEIYLETFSAEFVEQAAKVREC